jgi:hypothetical protein
MTDMFGPMFVELSLADYSNEITRTKLRGPKIDVTEEGAIEAAKLLADAMVTALGLITTGIARDKAYVLARRRMSSEVPSDKTCQRETKWVIVWRDNTTGVPGKVEIGTADESLLAGNSDELVISGGDGATFKSAFEAWFTSPAGNSVTVERIFLTGARL